MKGPAPGRGKAVQVLLVEDNSADIRLTREAFRSAGRRVSLHVTTDGLEALHFLRREPPFNAAPRPDIILLDLKLPCMDGLEVLARIKQDDSLQTIPTIILSSSDQPADILKSYELNVNCYMNKPLELLGFETMVASITDFWLRKAKLPSHGSRA